ncbi:MAG: NAD(P)-dependent alcohol dehydrogenase [Gammaproteobacteria bacterium]|nr:NAD(P)-dependent alcohol dehydrogenase [Gammaproteobacteria bacterium]
MTLPKSQLQYQLIRQQQGFSLQLREGAPIRLPAAGEVLVRVRATSLNRRDIMIQRGFYPVGARESLVPLSDGAGEVVEVGAGVDRFKVGDAVAAIFFQSWLSGRPTAATGASAMGGAVDGMLAEYVTLPAAGLVTLPAGMSFEEGATLPCAAVTAWNGLVTRGGMGPGDHVLLQGTGGVSVFGLQFAAAAGAKPVITSSSDAKLERARALGAFATVNYKSTPEWAVAVRAATDGVGVHQVLEVGGSGTLKQSLDALAPGGHVAIIGGLSGFGGDIPAAALIGRSASVSGIFVGSRRHFEEMNAFIVRHGIKPVIDRRFAFNEAEAAYAWMDNGSHFGKIVIRH